MTVRTRFAPSPTGYLHVGGARTALFCYLFARRHGGQFILRIEDTDLERSDEASVQAILDGMSWLELEYDEGPFFQTDSFDRYREVIQHLLDEGRAYPCYCSRERLDQMREEQRARGEKPRYDGRCRDLETVPEHSECVIRFRNPQDGLVSWQDAVKGEIAFDNGELDDLVIARPDGSPTYNLTVVVDDIDMAITHVVRGDDHVNNTPRQINIYGALGHEPPVFAHVPMILGDDGQRLSKRHGAVSVLEYRDQGYLPEALLNYLVRLGWSHGDQELFTRQEMIEHFDLVDVNRAASSFNTDKLRWVNQQYLQSQPPERVAEHLGWHMANLDIDLTAGPDLAAVVPLLAERCQTLKEMAEQAQFLYRDIEGYEEKVAVKQFKSAAAGPLEAVRKALGGLEDWSAEAIQTTLQEVVDSLGVGFGKVGQPLRLAITGRGAAPGNDQVLALLGRDRALHRIDQALVVIRARDTGEIS